MSNYDNTTIKPSEVFDDYWIYAYRTKGSYPRSTSNSGKWLIFVSVGQVDQIWDKIRQATIQGVLGDSAKVATMKPSPYAADPDRKVICVYTYDWTDVDDVRRIRLKLRELGISWKIPYKADEDTDAGRYAHYGHQRISKYYE